MRCRKCGEKAVINMKQHRLSLCKHHFLDWLPEQVEKMIQKYGMFSKNDTVLVAVSGGKDSLALWDVLWRLGYKADGVYINLGIDEEHDYSNQSQAYAQSFSAERNLELITINIKDKYSKSLSEFARQNRRGRSKPCSLCGLLKRHILNQTALEKNYDVLVTAHNLDDEVAILLANTLDWSLDYLSRGLPILPSGPGFAQKGKPFCRVYERESAAYSFLRKISYIHQECPYSINNKQAFFKHHLNQWEEKMPGTKLRFYLNYLRAIDEGAFAEKQEHAEVLAEKLCPQCGQPTTTGSLCAFCRLIKQK